MTPTAAKNSEQLRAKVKQLEFLMSSSRALNATLNFDQLLGVIMKIVKNAVGADAVSLMLLETGGKSLRFELARGRRDNKIRGLKIPVGVGIAGWVAENLKPVLSNDAPNDPRYSVELEGKLGIRPRAIVAIPLKRRGELVGVLDMVTKRKTKTFTPEDLELATALGEHIATAVANARLYRRSRRISLESAQLAKVAADLGKSFTLDEVLDRLTKHLKYLIDYDAVAIFLYDRVQKRFQPVVKDGYPDSAAPSMALKIDEGIVGLAAREKAGIIVDDVRRNQQYVKARAQSRSQISAPIILRGRVIGVFNLESDRLRAYRRDDMRLLESFAAHAGVAMERARLYEESQVKGELEKELRLARTVQSFFSPRKSRSFGSFQMAGLNIPSLEVSGDYYDFFPVRNDLVAFAIADVAGKGMPASLIMSSFRATLHTVAPYLTSARQIALRANAILRETVRPQDFVTAFIGVLNPQTGVVTYCNAGHNAPVLVSPDGSMRLLETGGMVLGVLTDLPLQEGRFRLTDEVLVCYTDGATEALNSREEEFGDERLRAAIADVRDLSPAKMNRALLGTLKEFVGNAPQSDDTTFLTVKRR